MFQGPLVRVLLFSRTILGSDKMHLLHIVSGLPGLTTRAAIGHEFCRHNGFERGFGAQVDGGDGGCGTLGREKGHPKGWVSFIWSSGQVGHCEFENGVKQYDYLGFASK